MKRIFIPLLLLPLASGMCGAPVTHIIIDPSRTHQTIDGFGASDAWSMDKSYRWIEDTRLQVADWLFSRECDAKGQPKGIGLSIWRYNIGAGSNEQGHDSQIHSGTRTECILTADGRYDWSKQMPQRQFLRMAKERGVNRFLAFLNSPPVYFTCNGLATNTGRDGTYNLRDEAYQPFAQFIANVLSGIEREDGVRTDYVSPVNEPDAHWNWIGPKQEGTPATNREIARLVRCLDAELTRKDLTTKIIVNEASDYRSMFGTHETDWRRGHHIETFFNSDSTDTYLGGLSHVPRLLAAHSYWTNSTPEELEYYRRKLRDSLDKRHVDFWQSEVCIMSNDIEIGGGNGFDFSMRTALYVMRMLHYDIVYAGARSWQWWRAVGGNYKDGLLCEMPDHTVLPSKLLWSFGHYSRFVRPEAVRIDATSDEGSVTDPTGLMTTAYRNANGQKVVVIINYANQEAIVTVSIKDVDTLQWQIYRTSDSAQENLVPIGKACAGDNICIPPRSIVTLVESAE